MSSAEGGGFHIQCQDGVIVSINGDQATLIQQSGCAYFDNAFRHGTTEIESRTLKHECWPVSAVRHLVELLCSGFTCIVDDLDQEIQLLSILDYISTDFRVGVVVGNETKALFSASASRKIAELRRSNLKSIFKYRSRITGIEEYERIVEAGFLLQPAGESISLFTTANCGADMVEAFHLGDLVLPYEVHAMNHDDEEEERNLILKFIAALKGSTFDVRNSAQSSRIIMQSNNHIGVQIYGFGDKYHGGIDYAQKLVDKLGAKCRHTEHLKEFEFEGNIMIIYAVLSGLFVSKHIDYIRCELYISTCNDFMLCRFLHEAMKRKTCVILSKSEDRVYLRVSSSDPPAAKKDMMDIARCLYNFKGPTTFKGIELRT